MVYHAYGTANGRRYTATLIRLGREMRLNFVAMDNMAARYMARILARNYGMHLTELVRHR